MKQFIKKGILKIPGGEMLLRPILAYRFRKFIQRFRTQEELFTDYYLNNRWQSDESRSGVGSTLKYTENLRRELPGMLQSLEIKTLLDAPCGDFNWFRHVPLKGDLSYIGGDLVAPLVARNNELYGRPGRKFILLDIIKDPIPEADMWMCRDCLLHLTLADIQEVLNQFRKSRVRYLLVSNYPECRENIDIPTGADRPLNLQLPPFNLSPPQLEIKDWIPGSPVRTLALWERGML